MFMDQPIINSRLFGIDGLRGPGVRATWLGNSDRYSMWSVGIHNAHGATSHSFLQAGEGNHDHGSGHEEDEGGDEHAAFDTTIGGWAATDNRVRNLGDILMTTRWETSGIGGSDEQLTWLLGLSGAFGVRYEYVNGRGDSLDNHFEPMSASIDPTRDKRSRLSTMLLWTPSHFTRLRLQYNYDHAQHLDAEHNGESHGVWLGIDFMIGRHPAHRF